MLPRQFIVDCSIERPGAQRLLPLSAIFLVAHRVSLAEDFHYRPHQHTDHEVVHVRGGRYRCRVNGSEVEVPQGRLLVIGPGDWHEDFLAPRVALSSLLFRLEVSAVGAGVSILRPGLRPSQRVIDADEELMSPMLELQASHGRAEESDSRLQDALAAVFVWRLVRRLPAAAVAEGLRDEPRQERFRRRLQRVMEARLHRSLPVAEMAAEMGMSASSLSSACRRYVGRAPAQAFLAAKIERAKALLRLDAMSVAEVADHLGFADQFHFSKVFKRFAGAPPSHWRGHGPAEG